MHSKPAISVIVATYNHAAYISQTFSSLRRQTLPRDEFEVVVVNDGSTDKTSSILSEHSGEIRVIEQTNQGLIAACNRGLASAEGQYFARLDSDDFVDAAWLEELYSAMRQHSNAVCVYPDYVEIKG